MTVFSAVDANAVASPIVFESASVESLEDQLTTLYAQITIATHQWLQLLARFDACESAEKTGFLSTAHWLNYRCGIALGAAREKVRVARALTELPAISDAFGAARISYSKVRALTRTATQGNEKNLLDIAVHATASQLEQILRDYRRSTRSGSNTRHEEAESLQYYFDDYGDLVFKGCLPAAEGALLIKALEQVMDQAPDTEPTSRLTTESDRIAAKRARALTELAELGMEAIRDTDIASDTRARTSTPSAERYQIHLHVKAVTASMTSAGAACGDTAEIIPILDEGPAIPIETLDRLSCDASLIQHTTDARNNPLDVGRKTRTIPPAIRRVLQTRDRGCRFPGCTHRRFVDGHHIRHWSQGGATKLSNLVLLCRYHHRLIHEHGYRVGSENEEIRFSRPDGTRIPECMDAHHKSIPHLIDVSAGTSHRATGSRVHTRSLAPNLNHRPPDYEHIAWYLTNFVPRE